MREHFGRVCAYYPHRSEPRRFRASDAARVARYAAANDGAPLVFGKVAQELGYARTLCQMLGLIDRLDKAEDKVGLAKILSALATVLGGIAKVLKGPGRVMKQIGAILILLGLVQAGLRVISEILDELDAIERLTDLQSIVCEGNQNGRRNEAP